MEPFLYSSHLNIRYHRTKFDFLGDLLSLCTLILSYITDILICTTLKFYVRHHAEENVQEKLVSSIGLLKTHVNFKRKRWY